ncbi:MAG: nickel pincer cofactor biosynthesis protein LarC [Calditrichia bacterium]
MKIAYIDCIAGAAGDMLTGALLDCGIPEESYREMLKKLDLPNFAVEIRKKSIKGFSATKMDVIVEKDAPARHCREIMELIDNSGLEDDLKARAKKVFWRMCEAEAKIHNSTADRVHLHELSGIDTIVDVVSVLWAVRELGIDKIVSSPLPMGRGFVKGAHGQIPLPAPATIALLKDVPVYGVDIEGELVTPTGAALLSEISAEFGSLPEMSVETVGYGAGTKDFGIPNLLRVIIGNKDDRGNESRHLVMLETNIDDQSPELLGYVMEKALQNGALDAFFQPIYMKKNRPAVLLKVLCEPENVQGLQDLILLETSTLGIRKIPVERVSLRREIREIETPFGKIRVKTAYPADGKMKASPEFEDCRKLAEQHNRPLWEIFEIAYHAIRQQF